MAGESSDDGARRLPAASSKQSSDLAGIQTHFIAGVEHSSPSSRDASAAQASVSCGVEVQADGRRREWSRRLQVVCGASATLCLLAVVQLLQDGKGGGGISSLGQVEESGGGAKAALNLKALQAVKEIYHQDPAFVKDWALLTGRDGQKLLQQIQGPKKEILAKKPEHSFVKLDKDLQQLDTTTQDVVEDSSETPGGEDEKGGKKLDLSLPEVNQRAAWMLVKDLSKDWDVHSNYSTTPWEFCAGRDLSKRQIAQCTEHLMSAAGIKAHRDMNLNAKIYDRAAPPSPTRFTHAFSIRSLPPSVPSSSSHPSSIPSFASLLPL
eukprot:643274-Rhodomonas_salina.1